MISTTILENSLTTNTNKVLRNTYLLLGLSMLPTVVGAVVGVNMDLSFMVQSPILSLVALLAIMFGLMWGISKNKDSGVGVALLLGFTFIMGFMLGPILQQVLEFKNGVSLIGFAAGGTGVIFLGLSTYVTVTKKDFSFLGNFLFIGLLLLIVAMIANVFLKVPAFDLAISSIGMLLFSGYILYDVSRIVSGGETNYIMAALSIYLDIYNLFVNLLRISMAVMGEGE